MKADSYGHFSYDLHYPGGVIPAIRVGTLGWVNVENSIAAAAVCLCHGVNPDAVKKAIGTFKGAQRRLDEHINVPGLTYIDDYAHHPTEIAATLKAALGVPHNRLFVVFQPHTYTRTLKLRNEFVDALSHADVVVLADIYAAREKDNKEISSADLADDLRKLGKDAYYFPTFEKIIDFLKEKCVNEDLLITMGAGNVVNVGISFLKS